MSEITKLQANIRLDIRIV